MNTKLLKMARRRLRIVKRDYDYELQARNDSRWEYLYDGSLPETLRIMHAHMRLNLREYYIEVNKPTVIC